MAPDPQKIHFGNFFNVFQNPATDMKNGELGFDSTFRLIYKDYTGTLNPLISLSDYNNLYTPNVIQITQNAALNTVGLGAEGDFSTNVTKSMPQSAIITATGIHNRLMLVQYTSANVVKDIILFPEYFMKMGAYADQININTGMMIEQIKKLKFVTHITRTALVNNAIFKIQLMDTADVQTTLGYPLTTEANRDLIANRDQMYIGADNYLYIIKDIAILTLTAGFWIFNRRSNAVGVKVDTKVLLLEKNDKFSFETYRSTQNNIVTTPYEFITSIESFQINRILKAVKTVVYGKINDILTITADLKHVDGIEVNAYYNIVVSTNESIVLPTFVYKFINITDGFFSFIYSTLKNITDNEQAIPIDIASIIETTRLAVQAYVDAQLLLKANLNSPIFTGNVQLPATTTIGTVTQAEILTLSGVTSGIQGQLNLKSPLASPLFTGIPTAPTAAVNTTTTQLATTAFVINQAATATPSMDGAAAVGIATRFAREDHIHPIDTSRAPLASPALSGVPTSTTAAINTNTTQIATTAFVINQAGTIAPSMAGIAAVGIATKFSREDHVHPVDTSRAPLASPVLTGNPTAPTAVVNTNNTQIATTAFIAGQAATANPLMDGTVAVGIAIKFAREDHIHPSDTSRAPLSSPAFNGTPTAPTAAINTNTLQLATTAFVLAQSSSVNPLMDGAVSIGIATKFSREDHVHPSDTSRAPLASPALSGVPTSTTAAINTNTTQIATTAFVLAQASSVNPLMDGAVAIGIATKFAREDHIHPSDTSRAPLTSPGLTGVPTAPTAAVNTNTIQLATTAFVLGQGSAINPLMDGMASFGIGTRFAREDHIHPSDTSRASLTDPVFVNSISVKSGMTMDRFQIKYNDSEGTLDFIYSASSNMGMGM
jgi:hypothetical protein